MSFLKPLSRLPAALLLVLGCAFGSAVPAQAQETAPPAVSSAAKVESAKPATEVDNPYGLQAIVQHGDGVSKGVLAILMIMSLGTWYLLVTKALEQNKLLKEAKKVGASSSFWNAGTVQEGVKALNPEGAFSFMANTALDASKKHDGVLANVDLGSWISTSLDEAGEEVEHRLQKGLAFLATVGSTSPFIGLFGTVWGILNALTAIGVAGQASIDKVAGPVGEALIMTAIGLAVAVPAVLGYNWLVGRNTAALHYVTTFGSKLRATLLVGSSARV